MNKKYSRPEIKYEYLHCCDANVTHELALIIKSPNKLKRRIYDFEVCQKKKDLYQTCKKKNNNSNNF